MATICDQANVDAKLCTKEELGSFILAANATEASQSAILSKAINLKDPIAISYPVKKTGFYCVSTYAYSGHDYKGVVEFRNAYGELPAAQIPKLPFYGGLTIVYAVVGVSVFDDEYVTVDSLLMSVFRFWAFLYVQNRHDIRKLCLLSHLVGSNHLKFRSKIILLLSLCSLLLRN